MTVPMYIGEIAPLEIRGILLTVNNCFITGGQFVASIVDGLFSKDKLNGWRYMLGLAGIPSFIQFFCFLYMPESPRWLISKERYDEAVLTLRRVAKSPSDAEQQAESIKTNIDMQRDENGDQGSIQTFIRVLHCPSVWRALIVGCSLQMFQQISGINTIMYYSALIIKMSGVDDDSKAIWLAAATASVNFVFTFVGMLLVERIGRRLLTLGSLGGVVISLCILAIGFQLASIYSSSVNRHIKTEDADCFKARTCAQCINFDNCGYCFPKFSDGFQNSTCLTANTNNDASLSGYCTNATDPSSDFTWADEWCPTHYSWLILLGMLLYLFFFAPGMGPMPWTINSELYPQWARSTCYSIATSFTWMFNLIISMTFLNLSHSITRYGAFYLYASFAVAGWIFIFLTLPETKGRTFEEVGEQFSQSLCQVKNTCCNKRSSSYTQMDSNNDGSSLHDMGH